MVINFSRFSFLNKYVIECLIMGTITELLLNYSLILFLREQEKKGKAVLLYFHFFQKQRSLLQSMQDARIKVSLLKDWTSRWNKHIYKVYIYLDDVTKHPDDYTLLVKKYVHAGPGTPNVHLYLESLANCRFSFKIRPDSETSLLWDNGLWSSHLYYF